MWYLRTEKGCTSIAALGLFFNLFILCKPYKGLGLLVLTWYRFLLTDVFNFLVMYAMIFTAFLIALQTLHNANFEYLMWMDQTGTIFPQIQSSIAKMFPAASAYPDLAYLQNTNPIDNPLLLSTEIGVSGCHGNRHSLTDTAFALLEISFGDGLADALEQARSKPYVCAGFRPDYLIGYLLVLWVFLTNTLIINMLISMMNYTLDKQRLVLGSEWLLDVSKRMMRYDRMFPELAPRMASPQQSYSIFSTMYWWARLDDLVLILVCIPEVHFLIICGQLLKLKVSL